MLLRRGPAACVNLFKHDLFRFSAGPGSVCTHPYSSTAQSVDVNYTGPSTVTDHPHGQDAPSFVTASAVPPEHSPPQHHPQGQDAPSFAASAVPPEHSPPVHDKGDELLKDMNFLFSGPSPQPKEAQLRFESHLNAALRSSAEGPVAADMVIPKHAWSIYLKALCALRTPPKQILDRLPAMMQRFPPHTVPTLAVYTAALQLCVYAADGRTAVEVLREMEAAGVGPLHRQISLAVESALQQRDFELASTLLARLQGTQCRDKWQALHHRRVVLNCVHAFAQAGLFPQCFELLEHLRTRRLSPSMVSLAVLARSAAEQQQFDAAAQALQLLAALLEQQPPPRPNAATDAARALNIYPKRLFIFHADMRRVMDVAAAAGEEGVAEAVFSIIQSTLHPAPAHLKAWHGLICAHAVAGNTPAMFDCLGRMQQANPSALGEKRFFPGPLLPAAQALARSEHSVDEAYYLLERWAGEGRQVTPSMANLVVAACSLLRDLRRAFETVEQFPALGMTPNAETFNTLMNACLRLPGGRRLFMRVEEMMEAAGIKPNEHTWCLRVEREIAMNGAHAVLPVLERMEMAGHHPQLWLLERCVRVAERQGVPGDVLQALQQRMQGAPKRRAAFVSSSIREAAPAGDEPEGLGR